MVEDVANVLTWAVCGGILGAVVLVWLFTISHSVWMSLRK
jgi:hypothetical protein